MRFSICRLFYVIKLILIDLPCRDESIGMAIGINFIVKTSRQVLKRVNAVIALHMRFHKKIKWCDVICGRIILKHGAK